MRFVILLSAFLAIGCDQNPISVNESASRQAVTDTRLIGEWLSGSHSLQFTDQTFLVSYVVYDREVLRLRGLWSTVGSTLLSDSVEMYGMSIDYGYVWAPWDPEQFEVEYTLRGDTLDIPRSILKGIWLRRGK